MQEMLISTGPDLCLLQPGRKRRFDPKITAAPDRSPPGEVMNNSVAEEQKSSRFNMNAADPVTGSFTQTETIRVELRLPGFSFRDEL